MPQQFHVGQDVEVAPLSEMFGAWRKAKVVNYEPYFHGAHEPDRYFVQFHDGTRGVFDAEHIRDVETPPKGASAKYLYEECGAFRRKP